MSSERRGNPGRIILAPTRQLSLTEVLRRRRSTLQKLVNDVGLRSYTGLTEWCAMMGVSPPPEEEIPPGLFGDPSPPPPPPPSGADDLPPVLREALVVLDGRSPRGKKRSRDVPEPRPELEEGGEENNYEK